MPATAASIIFFPTHSKTIWANSPTFGILRTVRYRLAGMDFQKQKNITAVELKPFTLETGRSFQGQAWIGLIYVDSTDKAFHM